MVVRVVVGALVVSVVLSLTLVGQGEAQTPQIAVGTYVGTHSGKNGGISLEVARDASAVQNFIALTLPGTTILGTCALDRTVDRPLAIVNGHFGFTSDELTIQGAFGTDRPGSVAGSLEVHTHEFRHPLAQQHDPGDECNVNIKVDWSAKARDPGALAIAASPTPSATVAPMPTEVPTPTPESVRLAPPPVAPTGGPTTAGEQPAGVAPIITDPSTRTPTPVPTSPVATSACLRSQRGCPLDHGRPVQSVLASPEAVQGWHITLSSPSDLTVLLSNLQVEYDLHVIGPDGTALYDSSRYGADDDTASLSGLARGEYTIYVNSPFGDVSDRPYVLQATVTPMDGP